MASGFILRARRSLCAAIALAGGLVEAQSLDLPRKLPAAVAVAPASKPPGQTEPELRIAEFTSDKGFVPSHQLPPPRLFGFELLASKFKQEFPPTPDILLVQAIEPIPDQFANDGSTEIIETPPPQSGTEFIDMPPQQPGVEIIEGGTPDTFPMGDPSFDMAMMDGSPGGDCGDCGQCEDCQACGKCWTCQVLPTGIIYHSYLAGPKEPRFGAVFWHDKKLGWNLDYTVGGRVGLVRYGTTDNILPQGFQLDLEGAAFPRVNIDENMDLDAADYRVGIPLTYGKDRWQAKLAIYHLSAHVGDEFLIRNPNFERRNYVRDAFVAGVSFYPVNLVRLYGEAEWAFNTSGGADPFAFQLGAEVSPLRYNGCGGDPFLAVNWSLRQDVDFGGNLCLEFGWQWRGVDNQRLMRTGFHLLTGKSNQFEFMRQNETQVGIGAWYDF